MYLDFDILSSHCIVNWYKLFQLKDRETLLRCIKRAVQLGGISFVPIRIIINLWQDGSQISGDRGRQGNFK